jgi:hypothetical protein
MHALLSQLLRQVPWLYELRRIHQLHRLKLMNHAASSRAAAPACQPLGIVPFRVVGLYDALASAAFAHEAISAMSSAIGTQTRIDSSIWSFDMLTRLDSRHASLRCASAADVIIVAARPSLPLPPSVTSWLTQSLRDNVHGTPVIIALYEEEPDPSAAAPKLPAELGAIAASWQAPLLCNAEFSGRFEFETLPQKGNPGPQGETSGNG